MHQTHIFIYVWYIKYIYIYIFLTFKLVDECHLIKERSTEVRDRIYQRDDELVESFGKVDIYIYICICV